MLSGAQGQDNFRLLLGGRGGGGRGIGRALNENERVNNMNEA